MSNQSEIIVCRIKLIQGLLLSHSRALKRGNSSFFVSKSVEYTRILYFRLTVNFFRDHVDYF